MTVTLFIVKAVGASVNLATDPDYACTLEPSTNQLQSHSQRGTSSQLRMACGLCVTYCPLDQRAGFCSCRLETAQHEGAAAGAGHAHRRPAPGHFNDGRHASPVDSRSGACGSVRRLAS